MTRLTGYPASLPWTPEMKRAGDTISSIPFFRKMRPRVSWIPRTTAWEKSLAIRSTIPVSASTSRRAPENDARGPDHRCRDDRRIGDGDGAHRLERLNRHREPVVHPRQDVKQPEGQKNGGGAQAVDQDHGDDDGQHCPQIPEGTGQLDPVEPEVTGRKAVCLRRGRGAVGLWVFRDGFFFFNSY